MARLLLVGTERYSINLCDFDLLYRNSGHEIVKVFYHQTTAKKEWFQTGKKNDSTRDNTATKLTDHPHQEWNNLHQLFKWISAEQFDYLCTGNQIDDLRREGYKSLHSEYGWLPWGKCFYIDKKGVGFNSSLAGCEGIEAPQPIDREPLKAFFQGGNNVPYQDFIYVPLQVDTPTSDGRKDFKFMTSLFKNNEDFLRFVKRIVPEDMVVLVKKHPASRGNTKIPKRFIDISNARFSKYELYNRMSAMICMNSTSAIEALLFQKPVFAYGRDIFSNKPIVYEFVQKQEQLMHLIKQEPPDNSAFLSRLLQRQIERARCSDISYVRSHYWTSVL